MVRSTPWSPNSSLSVCLTGHDRMFLTTSRIPADLSHMWHPFSWFLFISCKLYVGLLFSLVYMKQYAVNHNHLYRLPVLLYFFQQMAQISWYELKVINESTRTRYSWPYSSAVKQDRTNEPSSVQQSYQPPFWYKTSRKHYNPLRHPTLHQYTQQLLGNTTQSGVHCPTPTSTHLMWNNAATRGPISYVPIWLPRHRMGMGIVRTDWTREISFTNV